MNKKRYIYEVPIVVRDNGVKAPRIAKHCGFRAIKYLENTVVVSVTIGGHNYLKDKMYAIRIKEEM